MIQSLAVGETLIDVYGLSDGAGFYAYDGRTSNGDFATLIVPDILGVNDDPIAGDDFFQLSDSLLLSGNVLGNDTDIDRGAVLTVDPSVSPFMSELGGVVSFVGTTGNFAYDATTSTEIACCRARGNTR